MAIVEPPGRQSRRARKRIMAGPADLNPGERRLLEADGKQLAVFNVNGDYFALHNRCPHMGGNLCAGPVTGTTLPSSGYEYLYGREGEIIRCAWHGWEFEIRTGVCLISPRMRARTYDVAVEDGQLLILI